MKTTHPTGMHTGREDDGMQLSAVRPSPRNNVRVGSLWEELGKRMDMNSGTGNGQSNALLDAVQAFLQPLSLVISTLNEANLSKITQAEYKPPPADDWTWTIDEVVYLDQDWKFHIFSPSPYVSKFYLTYRGENNFLLPNMQLSIVGSSDMHTDREDGGMQLSAVGAGSLWEELGKRMDMLGGTGNSQSNALLDAVQAFLQPSSLVISTLNEANLRKIAQAEYKPPPADDWTWTIDEVVDLAQDWKFHIFSPSPYTSKFYLTYRGENNFLLPTMKLSIVGSSDMHSDMHTGREDDGMQLSAVRPSPRNNVRVGSLWEELKKRMDMLGGAGNGQSNVLLDTVQAFLQPLSLVISTLNEANLRKIAQAEYKPPPADDWTWTIDEVVDLGQDWKFHIFSPSPYVSKFYLTYRGENSFLLPTIGSIFEILQGMLGGPIAGFDLPGPIADIGVGATVQNLALSLLPMSLPSISLDLVYDFDKDNILSTSLGIQEIRLSNRIAIGYVISFDTRLSLKLGEITILAEPPDISGAPWKFSLDTTSDAVTLASLLRTVQLGDLSNTGISSITDSNSDPIIKDLSVNIGTSGVDYFSFAVESNVTIDLGKVKFTEPTAFLEISSPFNSRQRSTTLGLEIQIQIGSTLDPVACRGILDYSGGELTGSLYVLIAGEVQVKDVFDLAEAGDDVKLEIEELGLELDIGEVAVYCPSFEFNYCDDPSFTLAWDGMMIEVGGTKKLDLELSVPVGGLFEEISIRYIKRDEDTGRPTKQFTAKIQVKGNLIEDGLKLLGPVGQNIIDQDNLSMTIEKVGKKKVRLLMPEGLIPATITFGNGSDGLTISNAFGFVNPGKRLAFGAGGKMDLDILGITTFSLAGELSIGPYGFSGLFEYQGDIPIGRHIVLQSLGVVFAIKGALPQAGARTTFRLYEQQGELELKMVPTPVPYPSSFRLSYPGELSIGGVVNAFLGDEIEVPGVIGDIVVLSGTIDAETLIRGSLVLAFDVSEASFEIDCYLSALYGFFEGSVKGSFSIMSGFELDAWLKPIDLSILKISGSDGVSDAKMEIIIPGPFSNKELYIFIDGAVSVLGITATTFIEVKSEGTITLEISGDMWNVLTASLEVYGDVSNGGGLLEVEATFENRIIETITENSHELVNTLIDGAKEGLMSAKRDLEHYKKQLEVLKKERVSLIAEVQREQEELVANMRAAENEVARWGNEVDRLNAKIENNRGIVRREREAIIDRLEGAQRSLDEARQAVVRIDNEITQRRIEAERKIKNLTDEIKRVESKVAAASKTVSEWQSSVDWFTDQISYYDRKISDTEALIRNLDFWTAWKAAGYLTQIAGYNATKLGLLASKETAEASLWLANKTLNGFEDSLNSARRRLDNLPEWTADPTIVKLLADKRIAEAAIVLANQILEGAQEVVDWAPVDLDPRVAPFIVLKESADLALAAAYEAVRQLGDVVEDFNPEMHPRVLYHDGQIVFQKNVVNAAMMLLDDIHATVSGPISRALQYIADDVNLILDDIPLVIKGVYFNSTLSTASSSGVNLHIDYEFLDEDCSVEFSFNFSVRETGAIIGDFCKEIASKILDLADEDNTRISGTTSDVGRNHQFTFDELMNAKNVVDQLEQTLDKESRQMELDYEFDKIKLKRRLFRTEEAMLDLRDQILEEYKFMTEEDKVILSNIEKIVSDDNNKAMDSQVRSDNQTSKFANAVASIKTLVGEMEGKTNEEKQQLDKITAQTQKTKEEMLQEESEEEAEFARVASGRGNEEEKREISNKIKRKAIKRFQRHEREIRAFIEEDLEVKQSIISARKGLYDQTLTHMSTLNSMSDDFLKKIQVAARKRAKRRSSSKVSAQAATSRADSTDADADADAHAPAPIELDECERMILNMSMYQYNLASANESIRNRANYDKWMMNICAMEDNMLSSLNMVGDDGVMDE